MPIINQFKTALGAGGARPNQFGVRITFPSLITNLTRPGSQGGYDILVTSTSLPASNMNPTVVKYRGRDVKLAGERTFDPWSLTVMNDTGFSYRNAFEDWMESMNSRATNEADKLNPADYSRDIQVDQLSRNGAVLASYTLKDAFPINMSEIALNYSTDNVIEEYTVTFAYAHYTRVAV